MSAAIVLFFGGLMLAFLVALCFVGRTPPTQEYRDCPCPGCKILRERPAPRAQSVRDRLADAHRRELDEARRKGVRP